MKIIRITGLILFILSAAFYGSYKGLEYYHNDWKGPEIHFEQANIPVSIHATEEDLLKDVTAVDEKDGDVSKSILIEEVSKFTFTGRRMITYAAFDSSGHITKTERELIYTDYVSPRFALSKPLRFIVGETDKILEYMSATDCIDGDLTEKIKYEVDKSGFGQTEGSYEVQFRVTNSVGDTVYLPAQVEFFYAGSQSQELKPEILLSDYIVYIKTGEIIDAKKYLRGVIIGQEEYEFKENVISQNNSKVISKNQISIHSNVKRNEPGVYQIDYAMTTDKGDTGITKLLVIVEE
jgi:hypothetical protein